MRRLKLLGATAALVTMSAIATSGAALAQGYGYGPCTRPGNNAVGAAGPAMNGGQLMAGVGQCGRIAGGRHYRARTYYRAPGYEPGWGAPAYDPDYYGPGYW